MPGLATKAAPLFFQSGRGVKPMVNSLISTAIREARGDNLNYHGAPLVQALAIPERLDELTDIGNFFMVSQRVWLDGCGKNGK